MSWLDIFNHTHWNWRSRISNELIDNVKNGFICDILDVNAIDNNYETCLIVACKKPDINIEFVKFLLTQSADPNYAPNDSISPLY
jgi:ankyrin repeat protein